ncbi:MAG: hypothetical protein OJF59_002124 [Cytophagales bacterium]|jgi:DNA uptake protein ComE-like DNA-binding protein|nr:MAG: hypothetical protein OJF59_002124 [Cytophagales bacterium]
MNRLKAWIRSIFGFSGTETNAFLILLPLMVILIFFQPIYQYWFVRQPADFTTQTKRLDSLITTFRWEHKDSVWAKPRELFPFNPNQATNDQLSQLGISSQVVNRIINYRTKGGKFLVKKDLLKIYGMDSLLYQRLAPFIDLPEVTEVKNTNQKISASKPKEKTTVKKYDLNQADTSQLIAVYGIGSKLSGRIISYREKLGGFISLHQLHEVYGLDSMVIKELQKKFYINDQFIPRQLNLNKVSEKELAQHPYIKFKLAQAIKAYSFQHGKFQSIDDLKKIALLDEATFQKIKPYFTVNP